MKNMEEAADRHVTAHRREKRRRSENPRAPVPLLVARHFVCFRPSVCLIVQLCSDRGRREKQRERNRNRYVGRRHKNKLDGKGEAVCKGERLLRPHHRRRAFRSLPVVIVTIFPAGPRSARGSTECTDEESYVRSATFCVSSSGDGVICTSDSTCA